jgi:hypothetical protein
VIDEGDFRMSDEKAEVVKRAEGAQGRALAEDDLRVPRKVIQRSLERRRELLSMNFEPAGTEGAEVDIAWQCGDVWEEGVKLAVTEPTTRTLRPMPCGTSPSLQICFYNDTTDGGDRNFYVRADPSWQ